MGSTGPGWPGGEVGGQPGAASSAGGRRFRKKEPCGNRAGQVIRGQTNLNPQCRRQSSGGGGGGPAARHAGQLSPDPTYYCPELRDSVA
eukprot:762475-Hanusia_phi.AAC.5